MYRIAKLVYVFVFSLLVGFMAVVQWSLVPAQNRLSAEGYAVLEQGMNSVLTTLTPILMFTSLLFWFAVIVLAFRQKSVSRVAYVVAGAALVAMIISTLLINAPVNSAIDTWNTAAPPTDWQIWRDRWELGHAIRSYIGLAGLLVLLVAVIWDGTEGGTTA